MNNELPKLSYWNYNNLKQSIKEHGVKLPVIFDQHGNVIDGHHRIEIATALGKEYPTSIIEVRDEYHRKRLAIELNVARRHLSVEQINDFYDIAKEVVKEERDKGKTQQEAAEIAGVSRNTVATWETGNDVDDNNTSEKPPDLRVKVPKEYHEEIWQSRQDGKSATEIAEQWGCSSRTISGICGNVTREKNKEIAIEEAQGKIDEWKGEWDLNHVYQFDVTSKNFLDMIPENSIDFIITDPPYATEALSTYKALAKIAMKSLKPNRICAMYVGKLHIPEIIFEFINVGMEYRWMFCVYQPNSQQLFRKENFYDCWRPIVIFNKPGGLRLTSVNSPDAMEGTRDKSSHEWQQSIEPVIELINKYSGERQLILEPYCGGGTIPVACKMTGRNFIAFDNDSVAIKSSIERIMNV